MPTIFCYYSGKHGKEISGEVNKIRVGEDTFLCPSTNLTVKRFAFLPVEGKTPEEVWKIIKDCGFGVNVLDTLKKILTIPETPLSNHFSFQILEGENSSFRELGIKRTQLKTLKLTVRGPQGTDSFYTFHEDPTSAVKDGRFEIKEPVKMTDHRYFVRSGKQLVLWYRLENKTGYEEGNIAVNLADGKIEFSDKTHQKYVGAKSLLEASECLKAWIADNNPLIVFLNQWLDEQGIKERVISANGLEDLDIPFSFKPFTSKAKDIIEGNKDIEELKSLAKRWGPAFKAFVEKQKKGNVVPIKKTTPEPAGETDPEVLKKYMDDGKGGGVTLEQVARRPLSNKGKTPTEPTNEGKNAIEEVTDDATEEEAVATV